MARESSLQTSNPLCTKNAVRKEKSQQQKDMKMKMKLRLLSSISPRFGRDLSPFLCMSNIQRPLSVGKERSTMLTGNTLGIEIGWPS